MLQDVEEEEEGEDVLAARRLVLFYSTVSSLCPRAS